MFLLNTLSTHNQALEPVDVGFLGAEAAQRVERHLEFRDNHIETPLVALPGLAADVGVAAIHIKDEGQRLGLGSFKALGGGHAVIQLVLEEASRQLSRSVDIAELHIPAVQSIASGMTVACATDGNHGRSVAQGAQIVGARSVVFVHSGVSDERMAAITRLGAEVVRVEGTYDRSVEEAARIAEENGWLIVSDTSWDGYERIPGLVMQGYTVLVREAIRRMPVPPTHVFIQAGVGGIAAAVSGYLAIACGDERPFFTVVDPARAACIFETARAGHPVRVEHGSPTIMAMLECYKPSLVAWRVLCRAADAFMTVEDNEAISAMRRLARPVRADPAIVAGESGCVGLAGLLQAAADPAIREAMGLDGTSRILLVNTEGATDPDKYEEIVGLAASTVATLADHPAART